MEETPPLLAPALLEGRLHALVETMRAFAEATHEYPRLLEVVAQRLATVVGDLCLIFLRTDEGSELRLAAVHAADAEVAERYRAQDRAEPLLADRFPVTAEVLRSGRPFLAPTFELDRHRSTMSPGYEAVLEETSVRSLLLVALRSRGETLGMLNLTRYRAGSAPFDLDDLAVAQTLADHAALSIANARAFRAVEEARASAASAEAAVRLLFEASPVALLAFDAASLAFVDVNAAAVELYGYRREEFLGMRLADLQFAEEAEQFSEMVRAAPPRPWRGTSHHRRRDGARLDVEVTTRPVQLFGRLVRLVVVQDVTGKHRIEAELRQAQKMDAVGRLAGGIAHDFNNLLAVVLGYTDMVVADLGPSHPMRASLMEVGAAAERAVDLTHQLLAFSRRQAFAPRETELARVVRDAEPMMRSVLGGGVELVITDDPRAGRCRVDPAQLGQALMNLVINAREAMPGGGRLAVETRSLDGAPPDEGLPPGPHVVLVVTDDGGGIEASVLPRIFEPFFTTKPFGTGPGLGLSTTFGIVEQSGGALRVESEPGRGTTFRIYLPRVDVPASSEPPPF